MEDLYQVLLALWDVLPTVALPAFGVFLFVSLGKLAGLIGEDKEAQLANIVVSFFAGGGKLPEGNGEANELFMLMLVASGYYHIWKFISPYLKKLIDNISSKISP